jgi:hypothetical protein
MLLCRKAEKVITKKIFQVFLLLLFLGGCSHNKMGAEAAFSLGDALTAARERCPGDIYNCYSYWNDLEKLWDQAEGDEKELIEHEMLKYLLKRLESHYDPLWRTSAALRSLGEKSMSDDIRKMATEALVEYQQDLQERQQAEETEVKQKQEEEQKQTEGIRLAFHESRDRLIRIGAGSLRDKSAEEIKKLVDGWMDIYSYELNNNDLAKYFGADVFYKVFGHPQRKQLFGYAYYFYYECRDGMAQMKVPEEAFTEDNIVVVLDLSII